MLAISRIAEYLDRSCSTEVAKNLDIYHGASILQESLRCRLLRMSFSNVGTIDFTPVPKMEAAYQLYQTPRAKLHSN